MTPRLPGALLALVGVCSCAGLSVWQWQRAEWKERALAAHAAALTASPLRWAAAIAEGTPPLAADRSVDRQGRGLALPMRVVVEGHYVPDSELVLDNQRLQTQVGVMVLSLLDPIDGGPSVYVNRGFVPYRGNRRDLAPLAPVTEAVRVSGLLVAPPSSGLRLGAFDWKPGDLSPRAWVDLEAAAARLGRASVRAMILLDGDAPHGFTRSWQPLPNTLPPERHRGYALQWLALALTVATIYVVLSLRARRR